MATSNDEASTSPVETKQASFTNNSQDQTDTETHAPKTTTAEAVQPTTTEDASTQNEQTQTYTTAATTTITTITTEPVTTETEPTATTEDAQRYTSIDDDNADDQYMTPYNNQPTDTIQVTVTSSIDASVTSVYSVVTTDSTIIASASTCIANNAATSSSTCLSASEEETLAKMTVAQIAGIVVGILGMFSLLVACVLLRKRKNGRRNLNNTRRISPYFYKGDQDQEKGLNQEKFDNSKTALCQSYNNKQPDSSNSDISESVYGDNMFYSNSTGYHCNSGVVNNQHGINEKLKITTNPSETYHHTVDTTHYPSLPVNLNPDPLVLAEASSRKLFKHTYLYVINYTCRLLPQRCILILNVAKAMN